VFEYIELFYNRQRRHSALGYLSPNRFEHLASRHALKANAPLARDSPASSSGYCATALRRRGAGEDFKKSNGPRSI
jgi:hypothetical protein